LSVNPIVAVDFSEVHCFETQRGKGPVYCHIACGKRPHISMEYGKRPHMSSSGFVRPALFGQNFLCLDKIVVLFFFVLLRRYWPVSGGSKIRGPSDKGGNASTDYFGYNTTEIGSPSIWAPPFNGPVPPIFVLLRRYRPVNGGAQIRAPPPSPGNAPASRFAGRITSPGPLAPTRGRAGHRWRLGPPASVATGGRILAPTPRRHRCGRETLPQVDLRVVQPVPGR
jgi:hypothetical protein